MKHFSLGAYFSYSALDLQFSASILQQFWKLFHSFLIFNAVSIQPFQSTVVKTSLWTMRLKLCPFPLSQGVNCGSKGDRLYLTPPVNQVNYVTGSAFDKWWWQFTLSKSTEDHLNWSRNTTRRNDKTFWILGESSLIWPQPKIFTIIGSINCNLFWHGVNTTTCKCPVFN